MRFLLLTCIVVVLGSFSCSEDGAENPKGEAVVLVEHYDYHIDLGTLEAQVELELVTQGEGNCFSLPIRSAPPTFVTIDGEAVSALRVDDGAMHVCSDKGWRSDTALVLALETTIAEETWGDSQVGYSVTQDLEGNPFRYLVSWVGGCDRFTPCDNAPNRFATYRFVVDHEAGERAMCPGQISEGNTQSICSFDLAGGPTYSGFGLAVSSSWTEVDLGSWGNISATLFDMPSAGIADIFATEEHKSFTQWMVDNFGPYPYGDSLRFAVGPTYWNGFEHPGSIVLNDQLDTGGFGSSFTNPLAHTTSHEIAHQWAGDQTTLAGTYDFVWKEAMAEYLVYVHQDEEMSASAARRSISAWEQFAGFSNYHLVPGEEPPLLDYYGDVYGPGPMILFRQLEAIFDRKSVLKALASVLGTERSLSIPQLKEALEAELGTSLDRYFDAWVYGEGAPSWPRFAVELEDTDGNIDVEVRQESHPKGLFGCAFNIELRGVEDENRTLVRVNLGVDGMEEFSVQVTPGFAVVEHRFDPQGECLGQEALAPQSVAPTKAFNPWVAIQHLH